jgi:gliding motility-associated-like protein
VLTLTKDISVPTAWITNNTGVTQIDCINTAISLTATGGISYAWSDGVTTTLGANLLVNAAGTYTVTATATNGCTDTEVLAITKDITVPTAGITNNTSVTQIDCTNPSISLTATGGVSYSWSDGVSTSLGANLLVNVAGTYTVTATAANGCTDTEVLVITKDISAPTAGITNNTGVTQIDCTNPSISLTATGGASYSWSDGVTTTPGASLLVNAAGSYTVTTTAANGCTDTEVLVITKDISVPIAGITNNTGVTQIDCTNPSISLIATGGVSYSWSDGVTTTLGANLLVNSAGIYTVTATAANGCKDTEVLSISIILKPVTPTLNSVNHPTCVSNGTVTVTNFDNSLTYGFNPSTGISIDPLTGIISASSGTYKFAVNNSGCTSDSVSVIFNAVPGKPVLTGVTTICSGTSVQLDAWGDTTKTVASIPNGLTPWVSADNTIATVVNGLVSGLTDGTVTITYKDINNCTQTALIQVGILVGGGTATATTSSLCANTSTTINLIGNTGTVQWQSSTDGATNWTNISSATTSTYSTALLNAGSYYYRTLVTSGVCATTATSNVVTITVSPSPSEGTVTVTPDTLCVGATALLKLVGPVGNIQWQESVNGTSGWINITGATGATSTTCTTGTLNTTTYYKAILSSGACLDVESAIFKVVVNPYVAASVSIASDQTETAGEITICPDSKVVFTATPSLGLGTVVYQWKNKGLNINSANKSTYVSSSLKDGDIITCELTTVGGKCITGSPTTSNPIKVNVLVNDLSLIGSSPTSCNLLDGFIQIKGTGAGTVKWAFASTPLVVLGTYPGVTLTKVAPFETIPNLAKGNYRVTFNNGTCDFSKDVTLTDPSVPQDALLTVSTTLPICQGQLITITANVLDPSILAPTTKYHWKKDGLDFNGFQPQLGNSITVGVAGTYSVVLEDGTCTSNANDTILNVTASPVDLNISNLAPKFCKSAGKQVSDLTLLASNLTQTITWYDAPVNGFAFKDADLLLTGSYYAEQSEGACKSINRTKVDVTVIDLAAPSIPGNNTQPSCLVATGSVELNMPSAGVWDITATPVVGNPVKVNTNNLTTNPFTYSFTGLDPGSYTFQIKDKNGCVSPNSTTVIIDQQPVSPATPILDATEIYCASKSYTVDQIKFSPAPTGTVKYYDANDLAISGQTVVVANTVYKFSFDNGKCESKVKLATTIPFDKGPTLIPLVDLTTSLICAIDKPTFNTIIAKSPLTIPSGYTLLISSDVTGNPIVPNTTQIGSLGGATQTVYYNIVNDKGCQSTSFAKLQFKINEGPTDLVLTSAKTYCATDKPTIASLNDAQISGTGVLKWYVSETSITPLSAGATLTSGTYFASATLTPGCESVVRKSVDVTIESFGQTILDPANAYAFCKGSIKTIVDLSTKPYFSNEIVWLNANKVVQTPGTVLIPGTYFATLTKNGCISPNTQEIDVTITSPIISITPSKLPTCGAGSGILVLTGADASYTYQWTKNGQVMTEKGAQITNLIDDLSIKYAVIVTDTKGCTAKDTAMFSGCAPGNIPQIITPDGNGKNDAWIIKYSDLYPEVTVLIFNRWGALVYKSEKPYVDNWTGEQNISGASSKDKLPAGTYFYQIDKGNGDALESGYLELVK